MRLGRTAELAYSHFKLSVGVLGRSMTESTTLLESGFPWRRLRDVARREGTVKPPIYAMHRWWARRSPTLFRSILAAAALPQGASPNLEEAANSSCLLDGKVGLDPFVGGGTNLVEAARVGACVVGYDIETLAIGITEAELGGFGQELDWRPLDEQLTLLHNEMRAFYPAPAGWRVLHYFWAANVLCSTCWRPYDIQPSATVV